MSHVNQRQAARMLADCKDFDAGNLHAEHQGPAYVVYSYAEPIALRIDGRAFVSRHRWSCTTSKHQNIVRRAWGSYEDTEEIEA